MLTSRQLMARKEPLKQVFTQTTKQGTHLI